jgi:hypothetical protein
MSRCRCKSEAALLLISESALLLIPEAALLLTADRSEAALLLISEAALLLISEAALRKCPCPGPGASRKPHCCWLLVGVLASTALLFRSALGHVVTHSRR